jgi:hypothetical protein
VVILDDSVPRLNINNEAVFSSDKFHTNTIISIQRHVEVVDSFYEYEKLKFRGSSSPPFVLKAKILALFRQVRVNIKKLDPELFDRISSLISNTEDLGKMIEAYDLIDEWLYDGGVTQFVRPRTFDPNNPLAEDEAFGI